MSLDITGKDTICALSSAQGYGAIAIVRASGPQALDIFGKIFRKNSNKTKPLILMHGEVIDQNNVVIDDVMAFYFADTKSFTGEPSFEIHCHGNQLIIEQILKTICAHGARLAQPGEFSMRALLNGKIDLAQAESIADLIHAKSLAAKQVALTGLKGGLRDKTDDIRQAIISALAEMEARMDFPDEDLGSYDRTHIINVIDRSIESLSQLLSNAAHALKLHEGARVVICGLPNAGKSTLLNRLCGEERAIVHETAGTTRDAIEAQLILSGIPITLVDIAGIRWVGDDNPIEKIGIERAMLELKKAHVIIWLADSTQAQPFSDPLIKEALAGVNAKVIYVLNKADLLGAIHHSDSSPRSLAISAKLGLGISDLKATLAHHLVGKNSQASELFITRARQRDELEIALASLKEAKAALQQKLVDEVITSELRNAGLAFDRLFGTELSEDILDRIFSQFCIGK